MRLIAVGGETDDEAAGLEPERALAHPLVLGQQGGIQRRERCGIVFPVHPGQTRRRHEHEEKRYRRRQSPPSCEPVDERFERGRRGPLEARRLEAAIGGQKGRQAEERDAERSADPRRREEPHGPDAGKVAEGEHGEARGGGEPPCEQRSANAPSRGSAFSARWLRTWIG